MHPLVNFITEQKHLLFFSQGVRSLKFQGDILSAGTGMGAIKFIDIRQMKFLHGDSRPDLTIKVGKGWLVS